MQLYNYCEVLVLRVLDDILKDNTDLCNCNKCKLDIAAIALNNLKPRYVVTEKGELYTKVDEMETQYIADIIKEITKAIEIVKQDPRHT